MTDDSSYTKITQSIVFLAERANRRKIARRIRLQPLKWLFPLHWTNFIPERMIIIHG